MKEMAGTLRRHGKLLFNWFAAQGELSSGSVEGMNTQAKLALRKSYGFKTCAVYETVLYTMNLDGSPNTNSPTNSVDEALFVEIDADKIHDGLLLWKQGLEKLSPGLPRLKGSRRPGAVSFLIASC